MVQWHTVYTLTCGGLTCLQLLHTRRAIEGKSLIVLGRHVMVAFGCDGCVWDNHSSVCVCVCACVCMCVRVCVWRVCVCVCVCMRVC